MHQADQAQTNQRRRGVERINGRRMTGQPNHSAAGGAMIWLTRHAAPVYAFNTAAALICLGLISLVHWQVTIPAREKLTVSSLIAGFRFVFTNQIILGTITLDLFAVLLG